MNQKAGYGRYATGGLRTGGHSVLATDSGENGGKNGENGGTGENSGNGGTGTRH